MDKLFLLVVAQVVELLDHESRGPKFESSRRAGLFVLFVAFCCVTLNDALRRFNTVDFSNEYLAVQVWTNLAQSRMGFLCLVCYLDTEVKQHWARGVLGGRLLRNSMCSGYGIGDRCF